MLAYGFDAQVFEFLAMHIRDFEIPGDGVGIGVVNNEGQLIAGVAYVNYRGNDIEMHVAGFGNWLTAGNLAAFYAYPFIELNVARVTSIIAKKNKKSRAFIERLGYKREGCCRKAMPSGQDAIIYGLLKEEAKPLLRGLSKYQHDIKTGRFLNGQEVTQSAATA